MYSLWKASNYDSYVDSYHRERLNGNRLWTFRCRSKSINWWQPARDYTVRVEFHLRQLTTERSFLHMWKPELLKISMIHGETSPKLQELIQRYEWSNWSASSTLWNGISSASQKRDAKVKISSSMEGIDSFAQTMSAHDPQHQEWWYWFVDGGLRGSNIRFAWTTESWRLIYK